MTTGDRAPVLLRRDTAAPDDAVGAVPPSSLDADQQAAVAARSDLVVVLGGPWTGKSTVAVASVLSRVADGLSPDEVVLVGPTRQAAARLRDAVTAGLVGATAVPLARTIQSLGFAILRGQAATDGLPPPRLVSGAQQDVVLGDLLAGHAESGEGPAWPAELAAALPTRGFRGELRDLLMRAVEHGLSPDDLAELGRQHGRPAWVAASVVFAEYEGVSALASPGAFDPAWVLTAAAELLESDEEARARVRSEIRCVVVDDAQELTAPAARLLRVLTGGGVPLVLVGDPDAAVQTFRGADPRHLLEGWPQGEPTTVVLRQGYRLSPPMAEADARVVARIGTVGGGAQRGATPAAGAEGPCVVRLLRSEAQEAGYIAHALRRAHLVDGVPWSEMAVVVRGAGRQATLRRVLAARGVPLLSGAAEVPLRDQPAVVPLLTLLALVVDLQRGHREEPAVDEVTALLTSPLVGADAIAVRRLRRALRAAELEADGTRSSDELLTAAVTDPSPFAELGPEVDPVLRLARVVSAGRAAAELEGERWAADATAESVLWAMWEASGVAEPWRERALSGGAAGARADAALDAVVALFSAAAAHEDALPRSGPGAFLDAVAQQEVAADSLAERSPESGAVALVTPAGATGRQWRRVVVAGVQEGVWPDLRLRGSLLGSADLADVVTGRTGGPGARTASARDQVRYDETRLLHVALTRASESVLVTAVSSEEDQPSPFLDIIDPVPAGAARRDTVEAPLPLDLSGVVSRLRQELADPETAGAAVVRLAQLRDAGVRGADPDRWWALRDVSDDRPLRGPDDVVRVSPSQVEDFRTCGLRWLLTSSGGRGASHVSAEIGTLVHAIAEDMPEADRETIAAEIDRRWPQLGQPPGWVGEQQHERAHAMGRWLADYYVRARAEGWELAGVEIPFGVTVGRARLGGRVDRVERSPDGGLRVIDLKTGGTKPTGAEVAEHAQLASYQVAMAEGAFSDLGDRPGGAALVHLGRAANVKGQVQPQAPLSESEDPRWAHELVERTAEGMSAADFVATPEDKVCSRCPVRTSCPAHHEGGTLR